MQIAHCHCLRCMKERSPGGLPLQMTSVVYCATCGFQRCPHSDDHRNPCSGSNEAGQAGSRYTATVPIQSHTTLSEREFTIFMAIASGKRQIDTANALQLSTKTVCEYRHRALKKLGLKTNDDIVAYCARNGLLV